MKSWISRSRRKPFDVETRNGSTYRCNRHTHGLTRRMPSVCTRRTIQTSRVAQSPAGLRRAGPVRAADCSWDHPDQSTRLRHTESLRGVPMVTIPDGPTTRNAPLSAQDYVPRGGGYSGKRLWKMNTQVLEDANLPAGPIFRAVPGSSLDRGPIGFGGATSSLSTCSRHTRLTGLCVVCPLRLPFGDSGSATVMSAAQ